MSDGISQLSIQALLNGGDSYVIPMYQRNYAWQEGEIHQLIQDVRDSQPADKNYYLGTLVVDWGSDGPEGKIFETIDGQQRLTTLSLLACYLKTKGLADWYGKPNLRFVSRKTSSQTLELISEGKLGNLDKDASKLNSAILNGYHIIKSYMHREFKDNEALKRFSDYLFEKVQIMRVEVPKCTKLNHYFEIMNNRGEQLEKHEVLKARLLSKLDEVDRPCFHQIWEACANMEKYVQTCFKDDGHRNLFGSDGSEFTPKSFADIKNALPLGKDCASSQVTQNLSTLLEGTGPVNGGKEPLSPEFPERFSGVINFPNFLLQVLRISLPPDSAKNVRLDDKKLIEVFDNSLLQGDNSRERAEKFAFDLLKGRYFLDRYVIKKEFSKGEERWSLKRYQKNGAATYSPTFGEQDELDAGMTRRILMLLAAFHVSAPTMANKYWLNAALKYLCNLRETTVEGRVSPEGYLDYLENTAMAFMFDRYLSNGDGLDYFDIIEQNQGKCQQSPKDLSEDHLKPRLSYSGIRNNFVFNYLDYLLWLEHQRKDEKVKFFDFTFRSSVEHYYPQTPVSGDKGWYPEDLDSFGNLCLISHSKNSRLSNHSPAAKKDYYTKNKLDSIKQFLMMEGNDPWNEQRAHDHEQKMIEVLRRGPPRVPKISTKEP
jgi:hypothetical protein